MTAHSRATKKFPGSSSRNTLQQAREHLEPTIPAEHKVPAWHSLRFDTMYSVPSPDARTQVAEKLAPFDVLHDEVELRVVQKIAKPNTYGSVESC